VSTDTQTRWEQEASFFDEEAEREAAKLAPISPAVVGRYRTRRRRHVAPEARFLAVGDLRGKRVLDVGCGDGRSAMLLATLGAEVVGIDISPGAVRLAQRRAEVNGLADRATFRCAPLETVDFPASHFDVVWCDAILHHLLHDLDATTARFREWVKPGGVIMMFEPVNRSRALRRLRFAVAAPTAHTPDERPLEPADLDVIARRLPELEARYFRALGRIDRFVLPTGQYETAPRWRRLAYDAISAFDYALLSVPPLDRLGSIAILTARVRK
jgi:2-polyprenyl-3-methyl-5-hydroxy-6-metoxy-1,4-benzoquinol methylase